jgi:signal peptidase
MDARLRRSVELILVVSVLLLILGQLLNQPILFGFVETGSMQPTLQPGDGFIAVPAAIAGPVEVGDVVVYRPETLERGRVTHRVVGKTDRGYITKGDANPFTDQDSGERPVKRPQIEAKLLQITDDVVALPRLGTVARATQNVLFIVQSHVTTLFHTGLFIGTRGLAYLFFLVSVVWYGIGYVQESSTKKRHKDRTRETGSDVHLIMVAFAGLLVIAATVAMVLPAGTSQYGVVSTGVDSPSPQIILAGQSETAEYDVGNSGFLPVMVFMEDLGEGINIQPTELYVGRRSRANVEVTLSAPPEFGYYRRFLVEHRYLAILPQSTIRTLYHLHPWAPILAIDALIGIPFYLLGVKLVGTSQIRNRARSRDLPLLARLRHALRNLY